LFSRAVLLLMCRQSDAELILTRISQIGMRIANDVYT
jgi:hypothetical protein